MRANLPSSDAAKARPRNLKRSTLKPGASTSASSRRALLCEPDALAVVSRRISELEPYAGNARRHPRAQLEKLAASIREFGFLIPILVDRENRIIAGHARAEAARLLGLVEVPTIAIHHPSDAQIRAFRIADNRLAELAQWDEQALPIELKALSELDLSFDVEITGFELAEIDILIERAEQGVEPDEADEIPGLDEAAPPVQRGRGSVAPGRAPAAVRRRAAARELRAGARGRDGADGVHRSALQRADPWPCGRRR